MNEKHIAFCEKYLQNFNATKAYQEVYKDASYETANANASSLLRENPEIKEYLKNRLAELVITSNEIVLGITSIARNPEEKTADRLKAYDMLAKINALYLDRMDVTTAGQKVSWEQIIKNEGDSHKDYLGGTVLVAEP
jgi:phage terminase small subunit